MNKALSNKYGVDSLLTIEELDDVTLRITPTNNVCSKHVDAKGRIVSLRFPKGDMIQLGNKIAEFFIEDIVESTDVPGSYIVIGRETPLERKDCTDAD